MTTWCFRGFAMTTTNTGHQLAFGASESERTLSKSGTLKTALLLFFPDNTFLTRKKRCSFGKRMGKAWLKHVENTFVAVIAVTG